MEFILLRPDQVTREILNILDVLTETRKMTLSDARRILSLQIERNHFTYVCYEAGTPVAIGAIVILNKLGRNGSRSALMEDIAVRPDKQRQGYGRSLVDFLCKKAIQYDVYQIILNCSDENLPFYVQCGFRRSGNQMKISL